MSNWTFGGLRVALRPPGSPVRRLTLALALVADLRLAVVIYVCGARCTSTHPRQKKNASSGLLFFVLFRVFLNFFLTRF